MLDCINLLPNSWQQKIIHWPINPEEPFYFKFFKNIITCSRDQFKVQELSKFLSDTKPDLVLVSG